MLLLIIIATVFDNDSVVGTDPVSEVAADHNPKRVEVFGRNATFVSQDTHVNFLNVTTPGEPRPVWRVNWLYENNSGIAKANDPQSVIVTDGSEIYQVSADGTSKGLTSQKDSWLREPGLKKVDRQGSRINWFFATSQSKEAIFLELIDDRQRRVCKLALGSNKVQIRDIIPDSSRPTEIDLGSGVIYLADASPAKRIVVRNFADDLERRISTSTDYFYCKLSGDTKRLVLSVHDDMDGMIAVVNLDGGREVLLPVRGSNATWGGDNAIYFLRGSNSIWKHELQSAQTTEIMTVPGRPARGFSVAPHLSADKTWLAWAWSCARNEGKKHGTILIDLKRGEYRELRGWWDNVQWLEGEGENRD
ncbi:MAG: hypothetical protein ACT4QC_03830 [Planctomycetaceae bacterium]